MTDGQSLGGMDPFRIAVADAPDTAAALLPPDAAERLAERIHRLRGSAPTVEVVKLPDVGVDRLDPASITGSGAHAVVLSIASEVEHSTAAQFADAAERLISKVRDRSGPHLAWFTASTVDPDGGDAYRTRPERFALRALRFDAELVRISRARGVALIDADRIVAELGGADHVVAPLRYSPAASEALAEETVRVLDDIGFFEPRPLVEQIGAGG
jgi:hypothetical protein